MADEDQTAPAGEAEPVTTVAETQQNDTGPLTVEEAADLLDRDDELDAAGDADDAEPKKEDQGPDGDDKDAEPDEDDLSADSKEDDPDVEDEPVYADGKTKTRLSDGTVVTIADLKKAYNDGEQFRAVEPQLRQQAQELQGQQQYIAQQRQELEQYLSAVETVLEEQLDPEPDEWLLEENPIEYIQAKEARDKQLTKLQEVMQHREALHTQQLHEQGAFRQNTVAQNGQKLLQLRPELADPEKYKAFGDAIRESAASLGYTPQELDSVTDYRALLLAEKAAKWDRFQANKKATLARAEKTAKEGVRPVTPVKPGKRVPSGDRDREKSQTLVQRVKKSGSFEDALTAVNELDL